MTTKQTTLEATLEQARGIEHALNDIWDRLDQLVELTKQGNALLAALLDAQNFQGAQEKHKKGKK